MNIIDAMKELMDSKKFNQRKLANFLGISESMVTYILNGKKKPGIEILVKVSKALNVSVNDLVDDLIDSTDSELITVCSMLPRLRGNMTYDEYSSFLKEKGGALIDPQLIELYENGERRPFPPFIDLIKKAHGIEISNNKSIPTNLDFMGEDLATWVSDPNNLSYIEFIYNAHKAGIPKELLSKAEITIKFQK